MLKVETLDVQGFGPALHGMRHPMNSHSRADSGYCSGYPSTLCINCGLYPDDSDTFCSMSNRNRFIIGPNDLKLAKKLAAAGSVHAKYRRMIVAYADITAPLYWWKEYDTYKVGTVANSTSTMHKIHAKEFTMNDFSQEHLLNLNSSESNNYQSCLNPTVLLQEIIKVLNTSRLNYLWAKENDPARAKMFWWQMIQSLPSSYNQTRTVMLSYEVLANIYNHRRNHKLDEWHQFIDWSVSLPYSELFTLSDVKTAQDTADQNTNG